MDRPHHPDSRARDDAVRRATARDRRHFAKNAYPNLAHPRARRPGATQSASGRAAESGILAYKAGADLDRAAARALSVVGKTFGRTSGKSRPGKGANRSDRRPRLIEISSTSRGQRHPATTIVDLTCIKRKSLSFYLPQLPLARVQAIQSHHRKRSRLSASPAKK